MQLQDTLQLYCFSNYQQEKKIYKEVIAEKKVVGYERICIFLNDDLHIPRCMKLCFLSSQKQVHNTGTNDSEIIL